jgi:hypothetical protein
MTFTKKKKASQVLIIQVTYASKNIPLVEQSYKFNFQGMHTEKLSTFFELYSCITVCQVPHKKKIEPKPTF